MNLGVKLQPERQTDRSDEHLIAACLQGKQEAWSALIDKYKNLIYSIPIRLGMYDDAADIFQAVCFDLLKGLRDLREPRALPKWLMQTCYHKCLQVRREQRKYLPLESDAEPEASIPSEASIPEPMLTELEKEQTLRVALSRLSPRCGQMVQMLFFETPPRPYQQIAQELKLATGSIGFIRGRCLEKLKQELRKMGF